MPPYFSSVVRQNLCSFARIKKGVRRRLFYWLTTLHYGGHSRLSPSPIMHRTSGPGLQVGCICVLVSITSRLFLFAALVIPFPQIGYRFCPVALAAIAALPFSLDRPPVMLSVRTGSVPKPDFPFPLNGFFVALPLSRCSPFHWTVLLPCFVVPHRLSEFPPSAGVRLL